MEAIKKKARKKKAATKKMHQLLHNISADPCTYTPSDKFVSSSLVGVEFELEGMNRFRVDDPEFAAYWKIVEDGSLRDGGKEFVLSRPFAGADLDKALSLFDKHVSKSGHDIKISDRTSVHVHIDVRDLTFAQLTIFETALFNMAGETRANNIFATSL